MDTNALKTSLSSSSTSSTTNTTTLKPKPKLNLLILPLELLDHILSYLPWPSLTTLRLTHSLFPHTLLPSSALPTLHSTQQTLTYALEIHHLRTTHGYTNPHYTGFAQGWDLSPFTSLSPTLPCYHCLQWLPSATDATLTTSAFSRGMAVGKRDLGQEKCRSRVCVTCGVRCGIYRPGGRVCHRPVCVKCGKLGERVPVESWGYVGQPGYARSYGGDGQGPESRLLNGMEVRRYLFCADCVSAGKVPRTRVEFEHEKRWKRYEKGMERGKMYRLEKGRRLRAERGIAVIDEQHEKRNEHAGDVLVAVYQPKHVCPVMKEKRICTCWTTPGGKLPDWAVTVQKTLWIW